MWNQIAIIFNFIKYQLKLRWKFILFYFVAFTACSWLFAAIYPSLREQAAEIQGAIEAFDPALLAAFNIDAATYLNNVKSFIGGELLIFLVLANSIAFSIIAASSLAGNYKNKVIFNYLHKPISRTGFAVSQIFTEIFTIIIVNFLVVIGIWVTFQLMVSDEPLNIEYLIALFTGLTLLSLAYSAIGKLLATLLDFTVTTVITVTLAFVDFLVAGLSQAEGVPEFLGKLSLISHLDTHQITTQDNLSNDTIIILLLVSAVAYIAFTILFRRKDFYVQ